MTSNKPFIITLLFITLLGCGATKSTPLELANQVPISAHLDISNTIDDKVKVTINPGKFTTDKITFRLPKIVQGTYAVSDFGKFIDNLKAIDYKGNELPTQKADTNTWIIENATQVDKLEYWVNDTYDIENNPNEKTPFSPSGTNISENNYVLNLHGFIGYFESLKSNSYNLSVLSPKKWTRSSALQEIKSQDVDEGKNILVTYYAPRYFDITDNPMMIGDLDVEEFAVGNIKIVLSVFSPNKTHSASSLKETMVNMMKAQKKYLGDIDSTPRYDIYLYLSEGNPDSPTGFGALEHHTSTVCVLPESMPKEALENAMTDVISHEFFHILTPLSVHSEDVHYFNYNKPTFSKHLWMYEGLTEYFANHFQVDKGLINTSEFYKKMSSKIHSSLNLADDMSFTTMSENILEEPYASNYYNVYLKGALIGMCLDIMITESSDGNRSLISFMKELSLKYGTNKPFEDDRIIDEITSMTYPEVGTFFANHVVGNSPIDYNMYLKKVGLILKNIKTKGNILMGKKGFVVAGDPAKGKLHFNENVISHDFWEKTGVKNQDLLLAYNGTEVPLEKANQILGSWMTWNQGQEVTLKVERDGQEKELKFNVSPFETEKLQITEIESPTEQQKKIRDFWLKG